MSSLGSAGVNDEGTNLVETDVGGLLTEALTADVEAVLADQTGSVGADAAVELQKKSIVSISVLLSSFAHFPPPSDSSLTQAVHPIQRGGGGPYQEREPLP